MPLTTATASAVIAHTHGLGALRPSASDAGMAPLALEHMSELARRLGEPVLGGNRARLLHDEADTFNAVCKAIDSARDHINIESRLIEADGAGGALAQKLMERCRAGVRVNLLHDSMGSLATAPQQLQRLRSAGVQLCAYQTVSLWQALASRALQLCDHRKLLVVDGRIGFIGAAGVDSSAVVRRGSAPSPRLDSGHSSRHSSHGSSSHDSSIHNSDDSGSAAPGWRALHVQLEGPAVRRLQQLFIAQWLRHSGSALQQARYFPPLAPVGTHRVGVAGSESGRRCNPQHAALLGAIATARSHVLLTTAYLVPPRGLPQALVRAAERGVRVEVLLPGGNDFWSPLFAGTAQRARLLQAGVVIHERRDNALLHAKACVVDGVWASVGSCNIDQHSVVHNAEANLVVIDEGFARQLEQAFREAAAQARRLEPTTSAHASMPMLPSGPSLWQRGKQALTQRTWFPM